MAHLVRESGFTLIAYGLIALAVLGALGGISYKIRESGKDAVRLELQPKLDACRQFTETLSAQLRAQNEAVAALEAAGKAKVAETSKRLKEAAKSTQAARSEAERLRVLAQGNSALGACPAGEAVKEIRRGLR